MTTVSEAADAYHEKFGDLPTLIGIPEQFDQAVIEVLQEAVEDDEPLTDDEFRAAIGMEPLPDDNDLKI